MSIILLKNKLFDLTQGVLVALDGPAASGKGTVGKLLAKKFHLKYFDSGFLYRFLAFKCQEAKIPLENTQEIIELSKTVNFQNLNNFVIKNEDIANIASKVSVIPAVRNNINQQLRSVINENPRVIIDGRDIGSNVAPDADLKIFITANLKIRAERRFKQLINLGKECIMAEILLKLIERDKRDQERKESPLKPTEDSLVIDTSDLTSELVVKKILDYINKSVN